MSVCSFSSCRQIAPTSSQQDSRDLDMSNQVTSDQLLNLTHLHLEELPVFVLLELQDGSQSSEGYLALIPQLVLLVQDR